MKNKNQTNQRLLKKYIKVLPFIGLTVFAGTVAAIASVAYLNRKVPVIPNVNTDPIKHEWLDIDDNGVLHGIIEGKDISKYTTLDIPTNVVEIEEGAFKDVFTTKTNVREVIIPTSVKLIGADAFVGCNNISRFDFSTYVKDDTVVIKKGAFGSSTDTSWFANIILPTNEEDKQDLITKLLGEAQVQERWLTQPTTGHATLIKGDEAYNNETTTPTVTTEFELTVPEDEETLMTVVASKLDASSPSLGVNLKAYEISPDGKNLSADVEMIGQDTNSSVEVDQWVQYRITLYCTNKTSGTTWTQNFEPFQTTITKIVDATNIALDKSSVVIYKNNYYKLNATVTPADATYPEIEWSSSNPDVVDVIDGVLVPKRDTGVRFVRITAKIKGTDISTSCDVEVKDWDQQCIAFHNLSNTEDSVFQMPSVKSWDGTIEYYDGNAWQVASPNQSITIAKGDYFLLRGSNNHYLSGNYTQEQSWEGYPFKFTGGEISLKGDIRYLFNYADITDVHPSYFACYNLFKDSDIVSVATDFLPFDKVYPFEYWGMFKDCKKLMFAPDLPATKISFGCYANMFEGCKNLIRAPKDLAATQKVVIKEDGSEEIRDGASMYCYKEMFKGCKLLQTAPETLGATTLAKGSCDWMFRNCHSLLTAPEIKATQLADYSCFEMFRGCKDLKITDDAAKAKSDKPFFTCPNTAGLTDPVTKMFQWTNSSIETPEANKTYYLANDEE